MEETRITYRNRHPDKRELWIETTLRVTHAPVTGEIDGVVAISRDMTEHRELEHRLAALAATDGLTGLANRRHFDERFQEEWSRAERDGTPLSLLLMDVDRFKTYNDHYGHQAGDECLKSIAKILAQHARRPTDLAARYGGEEFAIILPGTDSAGCLKVGKNVRETLRDLRLPHEMNSPTQFVTLSIGGTSYLARESYRKSADLISEADRALYAAKVGGRDKLIVSADVIVWRGAESA